MRELNTLKDVAAALRAAEEDPCIQQVRGPFIKQFGLTEPTGACATAACVIEAGLPPEKWYRIGTDFITFNYPVFLMRLRHPELELNLTLFTTLIDLNDHYGWTWPQIADWLESLDLEGEVGE